MWPRTRPATGRMQSACLRMGWFTRLSRSQAPVCKLLSSTCAIESYHLPIRLQWAGLHAELSSYAANATLWFWAVPGRSHRREMSFGPHCYLRPTRYAVFHVQSCLKAYNFRYSHPVRAGTMERRRVSLFTATFKPDGNWKWVLKQDTGMDWTSINDL